MTILPPSTNALSTRSRPRPLNTRPLHTRPLRSAAPRRPLPTPGQQARQHHHPPNPHHATLHISGPIYPAPYIRPHISGPYNLPKTPHTRLPNILPYAIPSR